MKPTETVKQKINRRELSGTKLDDFATEIDLLCVINDGIWFKTGKVVRFVAKEDLEAIIRLMETLEPY